MYPALVATRKGDPDGLARLLEAARPVLMAAVAPRLAGGWCDSWTQDVVQEALLDIVRSHRRCRASTEREVLAWVCAIGRREVAELFRREADRRDLSLDAACSFAASSPPPPSPRIARALRSLQTVLSDLTEDQQRLLWMRWVASWTWAEVAGDLETTAGGAKRRWQSLLPRLRSGVAP